MFTGIIETTGKVIAVKESEAVWRVTIEAPLILQDISVGDSIAVNGVCLTVVEFNTQQFSIDIVPETFRCSNLGSLQPNALVNLERSMQMNQRISGHFVQGHVDVTTTVTSIKQEGDAWLVTFNLPVGLKNYIVHKGFIAVDGMSLTVILPPACGDMKTFSVTLIPHTRAVTIAHQYQVGSRVNLEVDMLGKYVVNAFLAEQCSYRSKNPRGENNEN